MNNYNIVDQEGYTWCRERGLAYDEDGRTRSGMGYWGHKKFAINQDDWKKRKVSMNIVHVKFLQFLMRLEGINTIIKKSNG